MEKRQKVIIENEKNLELCLLENTEDWQRIVSNMAHGKGQQFKSWHRHGPLYNQILVD